MTEAKSLIASVAPIVCKVYNDLRSAYQIPDPLPWAAIALPLAAAEDKLARLDERLAKSPIRDGWASRTHFSDACASLGLEGSLVHLDDLVLHDAAADVRTPTAELTRAYAVLQARRRIASAEPEWALSRAGLADLRGRGARAQEGRGHVSRDADTDSTPDVDADIASVDEADEQLAAALAATDAAIAKVHRTLTETSSRAPSEKRDLAFYDLDWDQDARLDEWRCVVDLTRAMPPALAAAIAADAWAAMEPLQHAHWLGRLLVGAQLRERGKARWHLPCLNEGLKTIPRERRWPRDSSARLVVQLEALTASAEKGIKDHDRWLTARTLLARKLEGRRSNSRLPALLDYVMTRPIVSARMVADELRITPRAAHDLVAELGLREATGRSRYKAWGVF